MKVSDPDAPRCAGLWCEKGYCPGVKGLRCPEYNAFNLNEPCWAPVNARAAGTPAQAFLCPSATGGSRGYNVQRATDNRHGVDMTRSDGSNIFFAHSHYVTNAGINQPWGRATSFCYNYDIPEPVPGAPDCIIDGPF